MSVPVAEPEPGVAAGGESRSGAAAAGTNRAAAARSLAVAAGTETQAAGTGAAPLRGFQPLSPLARARSSAPTPQSE